MTSPVLFALIVDFDASNDNPSQEVARVENANQGVNGSKIIVDQQKRLWFVVDGNNSIVGTNPMGFPRERQTLQAASISPSEDVVEMQNLWLGNRRYVVAVFDPTIIENMNNVLGWTHLSSWHRGVRNTTDEPCTVKNL